MPKPTYEGWETLHAIAKDLGIGYSQMFNWKTRRKTNDFPEAKERLGRFEFYDPEEVGRWVYLWKKATVNMGRGEELNAERAEG